MKVSKNLNTVGNLKGMKDVRTYKGRKCYACNGTRVSSRTRLKCRLCNGKGVIF